MNQVIRILAQLSVLCDCCPGSWPRMMTFGTRRKRLHAELDMLVMRFITGHFGQNVKAVKAQFDHAAKKLKRELKSNNSAERKEKLL
jgi:hypothetical protein